MTRRFAILAWTAVVAVYLLIVLGGVVRITGSGMGCGDHWPLCNGHLIPPLDDIATLIEWGHRLVAGIVSFVVVGLAALGWWLGRRPATGSGEPLAPLRRRAAYLAVVLLIVQILLGAVTVKLELPHWTVVLHFLTAMLILAALLVAATGRSPLSASRPALVTAGLALAAVLLGALTAKLGAGTACLGLPLCNGQLWPEGNYLQHVHWTHRLAAYGLVGWTGWRVLRGDNGSRAVFAVVLVQVVIAAAMILLDLPAGWRAAHVAAGTAVWAAALLAAR